MIFEGRDLEDLRKKFYESKAVSFEIFLNQVMIKFISPTDKEFLWPIEPKKITEKETA